MARNCPECGAFVKDGFNFCENCGFKFYNQPTYAVGAIPKRHCGYGTAALVLGIVSMCLIWLSFFLFFYLIVVLPMAILATIFGGIAYWGKWKDKFGLSGFILGLLVIVIGAIFAFIIPLFLYRPYYY